MAAITPTTIARLRQFGANSASWRARTDAMSIAAPVSLMGSAALRHERPAQILGRDVDRHHHRDDQDQDRADVRIVEIPNRLHQVLADPAGADKAEHGRAA